MSGVVDAMTVLRVSAIALSGVPIAACDKPAHMKRLSDAIESVAELIEATEGLIDANDAWMGPGRTDTKTATKRARDALARIQGGTP